MTRRHPRALIGRAGRNGKSESSMDMCMVWVSFHSGGLFIFYETVGMVRSSSLGWRGQSSQDVSVPLTPVRGVAVGSPLLPGESLGWDHVRLGDLFSHKSSGGLLVESSVAGPDKTIPEAHESPLRPVCPDPAWTLVGAYTGSARRRHLECNKKCRTKIRKVNRMLNSTPRKS